MGIAEQKKDLRSRMRQARLREPMSAVAATHLGQRVMALSAGKNCVTAYVAVGEEPPLPLAHLRNAGIRVLLPIVEPDHILAWGEYTGVRNLARRGRLLEPDGPRLPPEAIGEADVVFVPALAADGHGHRLGQGGGYYDRALNYVHPGTAIYAVCGDSELFGEVPATAEDHLVNAIVTPSGVVQCTPSGTERAS